MPLTSCDGTVPQYNQILIPTGLGSLRSGNRDSPWSLSGAPFRSLTILRNQGEKIRRSQIATTLNNDTKAQVFGADQYADIRNITRHILIADGQTTLRYGGDTYKLEFICAHNKLFGEGQTSGNSSIYSLPLQISLVFSQPNRPGIIQMCIPVQFLGPGLSQPENLFLKYWLYQSPGGAPPGNLTVNELLNFPDEDAAFRTIEQCLTINPTDPNRFQNPTKIPYLLILFDTPLYCNKGALISEIRDRLDLPATDPKRWANPLDIPVSEEATSTSYTIPSLVYDTKGVAPTVPNEMFRKSFGLILQFMKSSLFKFTYNKEGVTQELPIIDKANYFTYAVGTSTSPTPTEYFVATSSIAGSAYKRKRVLEAGKTSLNNIKCYPIDLWKQVDDDGQIIVDADDKPVDITTVKSIESGTPPPVVDIDAQKEAQDSFQTTLIFIIVFSIMTLIVIFGIVYFFTGSSTQGLGTPTAPSVPTVAAASPLPTLVSPMTVPSWIGIVLLILAGIAVAGFTIFTFVKQ
jgi:hypothetical protein